MNMLFNKVLRGVLEKANELLESNRSDIYIEQYLYKNVAPEAAKTYNRFVKRVEMDTIYDICQAISDDGFCQIADYKGNRVMVLVEDRK